MNKLKYEIKQMGSVFLIPFIIFLMILVYSLLIKNNEYRIELTFSILQNIIPLFAGWWTIFSLSDYICELGGDLYYTYNIPIYKLGILKSLKYYFAYAIISMITMTFAMKITGYPEYLYVLKLILVQTLLFSSISFLALNLTKDVGWTIFTIITLFVAVYFTKGFILKRFNYYVPDYMSLEDQRVSSIAFITIPLSIIFYGIGTFLFSKKV